MIAVDTVNEELLKTARFLNNCGNPAFDFTILEIRRYAKNDTEILVPHIISTSNGPKPKSPSDRKRWDIQTFFEVAEEKVDHKVIEIMQDLHDWGLSKAYRIWFGNGKEKGSFTFRYIVI